ncbi:hypothetical protein ACQY0O_001105 [Thecaphora frezii]
MYASSMGAHHGQGTHLYDHFQPGVQAGHAVNQHQEIPGRSYTFGHDPNEIHPSTANPRFGQGFQYHPTQQPQQVSSSPVWPHGDSWNHDLQYSEQPSANYRPDTLTELAYSAANAHFGQGFQYHPTQQPQQVSSSPVWPHGDSWNHDLQYSEQPSANYRPDTLTELAYSAANAHFGQGFQYHPTQQPQQVSSSPVWPHGDSWNHDLQYSEQPSANYRPDTPAELAYSAANPRFGQGFQHHPTQQPQQLPPSPMLVHSDHWQLPSGWNQVPENMQQLARNYPTGKSGEASSPSTRSPAALSSPTTPACTRHKALPKPTLKPGQNCYPILAA